MLLVSSYPCLKRYAALVKSFTKQEYSSRSGENVALFASMSRPLGDA
jgi:hypothetical protein